MLNWALEFDPKNINFGDLGMPKELKKLTLNGRYLLKDLNSKANGLS